MSQLSRSDEQRLEFGGEQHDFAPDLVDLHEAVRL